MNKPYHPDLLKGHIPSLDGWRAIAILFVLAEHGALSFQNFIGVSGAWAKSSPFTGIGQLGVQIFFGMSGFLITTKLIEEYAKNERVYLTQFYLRRAFRIIPAAIVFLITISLLVAIDQISVHPSRALAALLFFANYSSAPQSWYVGHFWSLAVEEHYYLVWPVIFIIFRKPSTLIKVLVLSAIAIALWRAIDYKFVLTGALPAAFWGRSDIQADTIAYGSLAAILVSVYGKTELAKNIDKPWLFIVACAFALASKVPNLNWKVWMIALTFRNIGISAAIVISVLAGLRGGYSLLQSRFLRYVGSISYSLYLWQQIFLVEREPATGWLHYLQIFPVNIGLAFLCAILSKRYVEKPAIDLGRRFIAAVSTRKVLVEQRA